MIKTSRTFFRCLHKKGKEGEQKENLLQRDSHTNGIYNSVILRSKKRKKGKKIPDTKALSVQQNPQEAEKSGFLDCIVDREKGRKRKSLFIFFYCAVLFYLFISSLYTFFSTQPHLSFFSRKKLEICNKIFKL